jgi:multiple sugar transport system substrate-binding protein
VTWPAQFAAQGWLLDLSDLFTEEMKADFLEAPVEANTYEGAVYGVPWRTDAGMLYYRRDLLEDAGFSEPPKTWDELKEQARRTAGNSGTENGFVFQGAEYEGIVVNGLEYIWGAGGEVLEGDRVTINSPGSAEGLAVMRGMISDGVAPAAVANYKETESGGVFMRGEAVFLRNWPYIYDLLSDPSESDVRPEQVGISALPVASAGDQSFGGLGGWNLFVNAASQKQEAAWEFIRYMSAPEQQRTIATEAAFLPVLKQLYEDERVLEEVPVMALGKEAIQNARPRPVSPYYSDMSLEMAKQFNAVLKGETSPEAALRTLETELQNVVGEGGS